MKLGIGWCMGVMRRARKFRLILFSYRVTRRTRRTITAFTTLVIYLIIYLCRRVSVTALRVSPTAFCLCSSFQASAIATDKLCVAAAAATGHYGLLLKTTTAGERLTTPFLQANVRQSPLTRSFKPTKTWPQKRGCWSISI